MQRSRVDPAPVVADPQHDVAVVGVERQQHAGRLGVPRDVGRDLLVDAIDRQVLLGRQRRQVGREAVPHLQPAVLGEAGGERDQSAAQAELVERLGTQTTGDVAHLLRALARRLAHLGDGVLQLGRRGTAEAVELQDDPGQRLPELVVQLASEPATLALLRGQRPLCALAPLVLEPVQHLVERVEQVADLADRAVEVDPAPGDIGSTRRIRPARRSSGRTRAVAARS